VARAEIDAGICGFQTTCIATRGENGSIALHIESGCKAVLKLADQLKIVDPYKEISWRRALPQTHELAPKCLSHPACPVPAGIIKAIEVEANLALPKDVTIKVTKD
jgi:hypothetical protein